MRKRFHDIAEKGRIADGAFASRHGDQYGAFMLLHKDGGFLKVIAGNGTESNPPHFPDGMRWEHVSVSLKDRCPTWTEMCWVKSLFFEPEECVIQYHPPASKYVNVTATVLHMWRPLDEAIPMPPLECV